MLATISAPAEASADARQATRQLVEVLGDLATATNAIVYNSLGDRVAALAPFLEPGDASADARLLLDAMGKANPNYLRELAAAVVIDAIARLLPGVLGNSDCREDGHRRDTDVMRHRDGPGVPWGVVTADGSGRTGCRA